MRYLITFSYDGSNYNGYQIQKNKPTIQGELERILSMILNDNVKVSASGRTDAKVHAVNQKAHFDCCKKLDLIKFKMSLNKLMPSDIYIKDIKNVKDDFHARFNVKEKEYHYKINLKEYNPFDRKYIYQYNRELNIDKMIEASKYLIGTHNYKSFTKSDINRDDYIRTIKQIKIVNKDILTIKFTGNGFLRYMVRNIVGTLIAVGEEKIEPNAVKKILELQDRTKALKTSPPEGLYLYNVKY